MTTFIGLFTEEGLDQVCSTQDDAARERNDLHKMGCKVNLYVVRDEAVLYAIDDWMRDGVSFGTARNRVEAGQYLNLACMA